jgi:hypothetical protein
MVFSDPFQGLGQGMADGRSGADDPRARKRAEELLMGARFDDARRELLALEGEHPASAGVATRLAELALLDNRPEAAIGYLDGIGSQPLSPHGRWVQAQSLRRAGRSAAAADWFRRLGRPEFAAALEAFDNRPPYRVLGTASRWSIPFVASEPLPLVSAVVNGSAQGSFLVDTGAGDVLLDEAFARNAGVVLGGRETGQFAGGRHGSVRHGRADTLQMGELELADLPLEVLDLSTQLAGFYQSHEVAGIIGLELLSRFNVVLDYPGGALHLQRRKRATEVPGEDDRRFWIAGDHYPVAWGRLNDRPLLWFLDTGMSGYDCLVSSQVATAVGVRPSGGTGHGYGGGGPVETAPFIADSVCLGPVCARPARGVMAAGFPLARRFGFHVGGLLAHGFIRHYRLSLDFDAMTVAMTPSEDDPENAGEHRGQ